MITEFDITVEMDRLNAAAKKFGLTQGKIGRRYIVSIFLLLHWRA